MSQLPISGLTGETGRARQKGKRCLTFTFHSDVSLRRHLVCLLVTIYPLILAPQLRYDDDDDDDDYDDDDDDIIEGDNIDIYGDEDNE